jgi:hypothetical protein
MYAINRTKALLEVVPKYGGAKNLSLAIKVKQEQFVPLCYKYFLKK